MTQFCVVVNQFMLKFYSDKMSLQIRSLSPELQKLACEQLFEEPDKIPEMIQKLKDFINKSPHLRARTDDQFLVTFLRCCKYSIERTKHKIDMFYTLRTHMPELMQDRDPEKLKLSEIMKTGAMLPLLNTVGPDTPRIILSIVGGYDAKLFSIEEMMKSFLLVGDIMMEEDDQMIIAGQIIIIDFQKARLADFVSFSPSMMKKLITLIQEGSPFRLKSIHYVNVPPWFEKMFNAFRNFMNDKMKARLHVHGGDMTSLHSIFPKSILPIEYGGDKGSVDEISKYWEKKVLANRKFLIDASTKYGVDERKRIGMRKSAESLFGIQGSFRQLDFD